MTYYQPPQQTERPRCWGISYDNESYECTKRCGFNQSCKEKVQQGMLQSQAFRPQPSATPQPYYQPPQQQQYYSPTQMVPAGYAAPAPHVPLPVIQQGPPRQAVAPPMQVYQPPQQARPTPTAMPQPQQQAMMLPQQPPSWAGTIGVYGAYQDPAFHMVSQAPGVYRPQMSGESFGERLAKNILLSAMEQIFAQCWLGVRQAVFFPAPPEPPDITPYR